MHYYSLVQWFMYKHNKLMNTFIQVLCNMKYSAFCTDISYKAGIVNHAMINKMANNTGTMFV